MLKSIFKTATFRQSSITFIGTLLNGFLGALFYILVARILGPTDFGIVTISIVTLTLIADIADLGTNTGLVRFVSANLVSNKEKALRFLKLGLEIKLVVWVCSFLIFYLLSPFLAENIFHKKELILPLRLVAFGSGGALLFSFATSSLQAFQKYLHWSLISITTNFLRLILVVVLSTYLSLNVYNAIISYIALPFFGFFLTLFLLPTLVFLKSKNELSLSKEFFSFNIWVALFTIIAAFSSRLDTYLSATLLSAKEVGIYGSANQLIQVVPQLVGALGVVAAPKFSGFQSQKEMLIYLKKFQLMVTGLVILGTLTIPFASFFVPLIYGQQYISAEIPFIFLLFAMLVFLFSVPVHNSIIFYYGRSDIFVWVSVGHLIIIAGLGFFMISQFGLIGASLTVLVGTIFNFVIPLIWLLIKINSKDKR